MVDGGIEALDVEKWWSLKVERWRGVLIFEGGKWMGSWLCEQITE